MNTLHFEQYAGSLGRFSLTTLCFFIFVAVGWGQEEIKFKHYITEENTSIDHISSIIQDRRGWLWMASMGTGLKRFDGRQFTQYKPDPDQPNSLTDNHIRSIYEDRDGKIWIAGVGSGLSRYDPEIDQFVHYRHQADDPTSLSNNDVRGVIEDKRGDIWVGTATKGLNRLDRKTGYFQHYRSDPDNPNTLSDDNVRSIIEDRKGNIWIGTLAGLDRLEPQTGKFTHFRHDPEDAQTLSDGAVTSLFEDRKGYLWVGTTGTGLNYLNPETKKIKRFRPHPTDRNKLNTRSIFEDKNSNMWFGTWGGLFRFDAQTEQFHSYLPDPDHPGFSINNIIWSIFQDREGTYWMGTDDGGLYSFEWQEARVQHYQQDPANPHSLSNNTVNYIYKDFEGAYWIGTNSGLNHFDPVSQTFINYLPNPEDNNPWFFESENTIFQIYEAKNHHLWIGTARGLQRFDRKTKKFIALGSDWDALQTLEERYIRTIYEDSSDRLWIGTGFLNNGLFLYDPSTNSCIPYWDRSGRDNLVNSILEDGSGRLWVGTGTGLLLLDQDTGEFTSFRSDPDDPHSIGNDGITELFEDKKGNLWVGTGTSLDLLRGKESYYFEHFTEQDGLSSSDVSSILEDDEGNLWISGYYKGYTIFQPDSGTFKNHYALNGVNLEGMKAPIFQDPETKEMWLGTEKGLFIIHPDSLPHNDSIPPVYINRLSTYSSKNEKNGFRDVKAIWSKKSITLPFHENTFTAEFSILSYKNPTRNEAKYQLEGVNENWVNIGGKREVTFSNLRPGQYTLRVQGSNNDGVWNEEGATLHITILPPWWQTWWARTIYALAGLFLIYGAFRWRTAEQRKKLASATQMNKRLQQVDKLKDQFLANTSHELRTPLQGIIGLSESLYEQEDQPEKQENLTMIISSGKRLNNLVNDILDFSKLKNFDIELLQKPVSVHALVDIVLKNNAPLTIGKKLKLINAVPGDLPAAFADENRLQQVLYNLVGNAIKFTETGHVKVSAIKKEGLLQIGVEDTGTGVPENKRETIFQEFEQGDGSISREFAGTGLGLSISKRLVELHGGQMWMESQVGKGSEFIFTLPVSTEKATTLIPAKEAARLARQAISVGADGRNLQDSFHLVSLPLQGEGRGGVRILVVDDEPINQQVLKNHLSGRDFQLTQAMNGEEAIKAIQNQRPFDLVLLDVMMPRMSGYEVCQKIREKYLSSELPVIMVTAKNQLQDIVQGLSLGANDYLPKPFHKEELLARINTQLDLHRIFAVAGRFVPGEFLHVLNRERITEVMLGDYAEKEVTVLFTDIRDYTSLSEAMTPEENFKFVNAFHGRMGPIIQQHGGFVNQYLGDAIMAIFPKNPKDALQAAIDMQKTLRKYNAKRQTQNRLSLKMGVGLHTGSLIMGIIGDQNRMDAATIADTVNTASRIESLTKHYGASILISEDSLRKMPGASETDEKHLENAFHRDETHLGRLRNLGKVQVKGKQEPVGIYECFDGDAPETVAQKLKTIHDFEKGLTHFYAREFPEASGAFNQVLKTNPADHPARLFLNKSSRYTIEGVPEDWTGVEIMTFK